MKIKNTLFYTLCFIMSKGVLLGQTVPQHTQYVFNSFYINPAATGISGSTQIQSNVRSQYTGYLSDLYPGGSNLSTVFSADLPFSKVKGGLGLFVSSNNFSKIQNKQEFNLSYAYHKRINANILSLGLSAGINSLGLKFENYTPRDLEDPLLLNLNQNFLSPSLQAGVFFKTPVYQIGLSSKNILGSPYKIQDGASVREKRTYYATAKYDWGVSYTLDISPMVFLKTDLGSISTDVGVMATYNQKYWFGLNYRWQDAAGVLIGGNFLKNKIKLGYALDYVIEGQNAKSPTSHELMIRYILEPIRFGKKAIIRTPRYN
jgi:type IX secretion system PorP/SprF family membrane protein